MYSLQTNGMKGGTKGSNTQICLSDDTPFRERSRRIAPADVDDLQRHLQGLLVAGIIKESRRPYASPIVLARKKNQQNFVCVWTTVPLTAEPSQISTLCRGSMMLSIVYSTVNGFQY